MIGEGNFGYNSQNDDEIQNFIPRITVMGVGGAGCNAVGNMISQGIDGVDFVVANTDAQSLMLSKAPRKIQLGKQTTRGFGAGSKPEVGKTAAEESLNEIADVVKNANILFLTGGMGGGTGSGAIPVIASVAKEKGILTIAIITTPFDFEGEKKKRIAEEAIAELLPNVDCVITLPNQNLFKVADKQMSFINAFKLSDNVLYEGVRNITDLIMKPGLINLDFADIRTVMEGQGKTIIGTSVQSGEDRALKAVKGALLNPLLSNESISGAKGILVNITGNADNLSLEEVNDIMNTIRADINSNDVNFGFGTCFDPSMGDSLKVAIIATGINGDNVKSDVNTTKTEVNNTSYNSFNNVATSKPYSFTNIEEKKEEVRVEPKPMEKPMPSFMEETVVSDNKLDNFFKTGDEKDIQAFIDEEAEKLNVASSVSNELFPDEKNSILDSNEDTSSLDNVSLNGNGDDDHDPEPPKGKKKNPLSSFFDMIGEKDSDDTFFDDVEKDDNGDVKFENQSEISDKKEDDNVVFLAGNLDTKDPDDKQIDLMEMIKKMEETLEIPAIFKKGS